MAELAGTGRAPERPDDFAGRGVQGVAAATRARGAALGAHIDQAVPVDDRPGQAALAAAALATGGVAAGVTLILDEHLPGPHDRAGALVQGVDDVCTGDGEGEPLAKGHPAHVGRLAADARLPFDAPGTPVDGEDVLLGGGDVEDAVLGDDSALLGAAGVTALQVDVPGPTELLHIARGDLLEGRVVLVGQVAARLGEITVRRLEGLLRYGQGQRSAARFGRLGRRVEERDGRCGAGRRTGEKTASVHEPSFMTCPCRVPGPPGGPVGGEGERERGSGSWSAVRFT